ncbi:MAG: hypothetical protein ACK5MR_19020 [Cumulibacter sp.]
MIDLPDRVVVPFGRVVQAQWDPAIAERVVTVAVPGLFVGLTEDEYAVWSAAAAGSSAEELMREVRVDGPRTSYDAVRRYGLLAEIATSDDQVLTETAGMRLLAHSRLGVHGRHGLVVGEPDATNVVLSPVGVEIYGRCAGAHSLAAAVALVSSLASETGSNDPEVIYPQRLARRALAEFFPLVREGLASFGYVEGVRDE